MTYRQEKASMEQLLAPVLSECQFQLNRMPKRSCYVSLRTDFGKGIMDAHCQTSCPHSWMELPEIQIKYLNLFSLSPHPPACLVPIRSPESKKQPCERSCQRAEDAHVQLKQPFPPLSPHPPAPSLLPTWGQEDDYLQPAVLQCPDGHLPPTVHCRSVNFSPSLSLSLFICSSADTQIRVSGSAADITHALSFYKLWISPKI